MGKEPPMGQGLSFTLSQTFTNSCSVFSLRSKNTEIEL